MSPTQIPRRRSSRWELFVLLRTGAELTASLSLVGPANGRAMSSKSDSLNVAAVLRLLQREATSYVGFQIAWMRLKVRWWILQARWRHR
jgi:hypothetical protein